MIVSNVHAKLRHAVLIASILLVFMSSGLPTASGQTAPSSPGQSSPIDGAISDSIWYDADTGIIPVELDPETNDSINRDSRWLPKPDRVKKPDKPNAASGTTGGGNGLFGSGFTIGNVLGWLLLAIGLAATMAILVYLLSQAEVDLAANPRRGMGNRGMSPDEQTIERMKHLPAELRRTDVNLRSEAERLMQAGQFDQAIILLFGHQLLLLDRVSMLRLNRGKTNRKYVRETRAADPPAADILESTVVAFERSYFGRHEISASEFATLWNSNQDLEQSIAPETGVAV